MADPTVITSIQNYLAEVNKQTPVTFGVLFGSHITGRTSIWSDIDLVVVASKFDGDFVYKDEVLLWHIAGRTDNRIEPIACGEKRWHDEQVSPIILIARREGQIIYPQTPAVSESLQGSESAEGSQIRMSETL